MAAAQCVVVAIALAFSAICLVTSKPSHPVTTFFGRVHPNGSIVDQKSPNTRVKFSGKAQHRLQVSQTNAVLKVQPFHIENGETVTVSWSDISGATDRDIVGIYCPETNADKDYLDYQWVKNFPTKQFSVTLYNLRSSCEFRYYTFTPFEGLVAKSNLVTFEGGPEAPLHGHLALTGDPTQMRVMWVSGVDSKVPAEVRYFSADGLTPLMKKTGTTHTYKASDMCNTPAASETVGHFMDPGFIHDVLLSDLKPASLYYYQYGTNLGMSKLKNFTTAPLPHADAYFRFIAYGDQGVSPFPRGRATAKYSLEEVLYRNASFVIHIGDIAYAEGFAYQWEKYFAEIESYASLVPYMVGIGNHEQDHLHGGEKDPSGAPGEGFHPWFAPELFGTDSGGECGVPMYHRFHMPENGNHVWWYSFNYGSLHYIMMSTEHNFTQGSRQYKWIENDLKNVNRSVTPWVIIGGHRAMYSSQKYYGDYMLSLGMRHALEDVLYKYKVNLALWAHYHSYERTCAVYKGKCINDGIVHITVGTAGKTFDTNGFMPMDWSLFQAIEFGYGRVTVYSKNAMLWEWVTNKDRQVADKLLITQ